MDTSRPLLAAATVRPRAAPTTSAEAHGPRRSAPAAPHGDAPPAKADHPGHTRPTSLPRSDLSTLLLARQAFDLNRHDTAACLRLAEHLLARHRPAAVLDCLGLLDASVERSAAWHLLRASALTTLRDERQARHEASAALAKAGPDTVLHQRALLQLGRNLTRLEEHAEAAWCHQTALAAQPRSAEAALSAAVGSAAALDWEALPGHLGRLQACMAQPLHAAPPPLVWPLDPSQLIPLLDHPLLLRWLATLACQQRHGHGAARPSPRPARPDRRPSRPSRLWRLGVLTGGRGQQALDPGLLAWFEALDRQRVTLQVYSDAEPDPAPAVPAAGWRDTRHTDTDTLVQHIRHDQIDLLLDLSGPGEDCRLGVLAQRPAPVQTVWLGHAGTTGAPWVDYLVGDPVVTPLDAQPHYSECIAQLPGHYRPICTCVSAQPPAERPQRVDCGLPADSPVLASFHPAAWTTPAQFDVACQILAAVPGSVLWWLAPAPEARHRLRARLAQAGLDPMRLVFAPVVPRDAHLARLPLADLVLDAVPGNAETAAQEALSAGVPVLTQIGQGFAARRTASLLTALRLPALVCADAAHCVRTAVHLLRDQGAMAELRSRLASLHSQPIQPDPTQHARDLEHLLARMLARHDAGLPPTPLAAEPAPRRD